MINGASWWRTVKNIVEHTFFAVQYAGSIPAALPAAFRHCHAAKPAKGGKAQPLTPHYSLCATSLKAAAGLTYNPHPRLTRFAAEFSGRIVYRPAKNVMLPNLVVHYLTNQRRVV